MSPYCLSMHYLYWKAVNSLQKIKSKRICCALLILGLFSLRQSSIPKATKAESELASIRLRKQSVNYWTFACGSRTGWRSKSTRTTCESSADLFSCVRMFFRGKSIKVSLFGRKTIIKRWYIMICKNDTS